MDYTRFPISEVHPGKCPDSLEFQSWKVNFKTDVMHWRKEVEIAKSIDKLVTPR